MTALPLVLDAVSALFVLVGAVLSLAAGLGLLRFGDLLTRMHAQTKPQIFGLLCILIGIALQTTDVPTVLFLVPIMFFQMLTTPVAAATLARGGYRNRHFPHEGLHVDALASAIELAERERDDDAEAAGEPSGAAADEASADAHGEGSAEAPEPLGREPLA